MQGSPRDRAADAAALALALLVGALVLPTLGAVRYAENPDEAYYLAYARHLSEHGFTGFRQLYADYRADPARWLYPNPLRIGYAALASAWTSVFGSSFPALSLLSLACHVLLTGASYLFLKGLWGAPRALAGAALCAFSPLLLGISRRAWLDGPATLAGLLVLWTFCTWLRAPARRGVLVLFALAFGAGTLIKETTVLLALPCAVLLAYERFAARRALPLAPAAAALAVSLAACAAIWWASAGGIAPWADVVRIILVSPESNDYAQQFGSGPWYRYLVDLLLLSPWVTLLGVAALGPAALRARERASGDPAVWMALIFGGLLAAYAPFTKNVRYVALGEIPLCALAAGLVFALARADLGRRGRAWAAGAVALLCAAGWLSFQAIFVEANLYDPMTASLLFLRGLAPSP
jgi:4-amino-4-deoxy-L-arabinose transferase-like glycosyltransferase